MRKKIGVLFVFILFLFIHSIFVHADECEGQEDGTECTDEPNDCTVDICVSGVCEHYWEEPLFGFNTDGNPCTLPDDGNACTTPACLSGSCTQYPISDGDPCTDEESDGTICTVDICNNGVCEYYWAAPEWGITTDGMVCDDDSNLCTIDFCESGQCIHQLKDCSDGDECTTDYCDETTGFCINTGECIPEFSISRIIVSIIIISLLFYVIKKKS